MGLSSPFPLPLGWRGAGGGGASGVASAGAGEVETADVLAGDAKAVEVVAEQEGELAPGVGVGLARLGRLRLQLREQLLEEVNQLKDRVSALENEVKRLHTVTREWPAAAPPPAHQGSVS